LLLPYRIYLTIGKSNYITKYMTSIQLTQVFSGCWLRVAGYSLLVTCFWLLLARRSLGVGGVARCWVLPARRPVRHACPPRLSATLFGGLFGGSLLFSVGGVSGSWFLVSGLAADFWPLGTVIDFILFIQCMST